MTRWMVLAGVILAACSDTGAGSPLDHAGSYAVTVELALHDDVRQATDLKVATAAIEEMAAEPGLAVLRQLAATAGPRYWELEPFDFLFVLCTAAGTPIVACTEAGQVAPTNTGIAAAQHIEAELNANILAGDIRTALQGKASFVEALDAFTLGGTLVVEPAGGAVPDRILFDRVGWEGAAPAITLRAEAQLTAEVTTTRDDEGLGIEAPLTVAFVELSLTGFAAATFPDISSGADTFADLYSDLVGCDSLQDRLDADDVVAFLDLGTPCQRVFDGYVVIEAAMAATATGLQLTLRSPAGGACPVVLDGEVVMGYGAEGSACGLTGLATEPGGTVSAGVLGSWWAQRP
jgi:hypothetical protein